MLLTWFFDVRLWSILTLKNWVDNNYQHENKNGRYYTVVFVFVTSLLYDTALSAYYHFSRKRTLTTFCVYSGDNKIVCACGEILEGMARSAAIIDGDAIGVLALCGAIVYLVTRNFWECYRCIVFTFSRCNPWQINISCCADFVRASYSNNNSMCRTIRQNSTRGRSPSAWAGRPDSAGVARS